jgi:hypothetical protein
MGIVGVSSKFSYNGCDSKESKGLIDDESGWHRSEGVACVDRAFVGNCGGIVIKAQTANCSDGLFLM